VRSSWQRHAKKVSPFGKVKPLNADFVRINPGKAKPFFKVLIHELRNFCTLPQFGEGPGMGLF
jgi:hypothetical protein